MDMVKVYQFAKWNGAAQENWIAPRMATAEAIRSAGGEIIAGTERVIDAALLDGNGFDLSNAQKSTLKDSEHPRVFFSPDTEGARRVGSGYLSIIAGVPWLAQTLDDARLGDSAPLVRLDPERLHGQSDQETGEQVLIYQDPLRTHWFK